MIDDLAFSINYLDICVKMNKKISERNIYQIFIKKVDSFQRIATIIAQLRLFFYFFFVGLTFFTIFADTL